MSVGQLDDMAACFYADFYLGDRDREPVPLDVLARAYDEWCHDADVPPKERMRCWHGGYVTSRFEVAE